MEFKVPDTVILTAIQPNPGFGGAISGRLRRFIAVKPSKWSSSRLEAGPPGHPQDRGHPTFQGYRFVSGSFHRPIHIRASPVCSGRLRPLCLAV